MYNDHQDIIKIVGNALNESYSCGYDEARGVIAAISNKTIAAVQQHLKYMQSQIDDLQKKLNVAEKSDVRMFIDWDKTAHGDKYCAILCRKVGDVVEIIDTQYSPYN